MQSDSLTLKTVAQIVLSFNNLLVNKKLASVNINVADLLNGNYILLLFVVLALGLCLGKLRLGSVQLGNSIGVLVVSLLLGQQHFSINTDALNLGFMLFIFCVGVEAGPNFFSIFFRDGKNYLMLALVMVGSALLIALGLGKLFGWDIGLTAGMLAGSMTSTPVLVGAGDTLRHSGMAGTPLSSALDNLSLGYALTYLIGLVSLIVGARYLPKLQHQDLQTSAQTIARERGLDTDSKRKVYLPVIRAYRVGPELVAWTDGKNLRELGIYRQTGCYIERIRRNGILANPDGDAVLQMGDDIALVGYPDAHARLDPSFRNGKEVFDRDLLDMRIVTEEIVVKNHNAVGRRLAQLKLTDHGCFLNRVIRSQIEMPIDDNVVLNKGDVLQVSGDARRVKTVADRIGFISIHSQVTDLLAFCAFFIVGLMIGMITFQFSNFSFGIGNAAGLLFAGIMLGFLRANHPTFGYIPQGALNMVKEFGLMVFMAGVGLSAGSGIGNGLGAGVGMALTALGIAANVHILLAALVCIIPILTGIRAIPAGTGQHATDEQKSAEKGLPFYRDFQLMLIGVVVLAMAFAEGSANDWLPLLMVDGHGFSPTSGSLIYAGFTLGMTVGRFTGGWFIDRYSRVAVVRASALLGGLGIAMIIFVDVDWIAGVSVILWGLGASLGFPLTISAASDTGPDAPTRVSVVATTGYLAFLVGPPLLGFLGEHYGLRSAMLVVLGLVIIAALVARAVAKPEAETTSMEKGYER